jgi:hypothetical protein
MRQIKLLAVTASLLLGACGGMPHTPDSTRAEAEPARFNCVQDTGSRLKPAKGQCLNVHGKVYTGEQIRDSAAMNAGEALYRLGL